MSRIPEFILQTVIVRGIQALRKDVTLVDQLFRNLSQDHQQQMRKFISGGAIDLCINYPRKELMVPAIVILLRSESEAQAYLGDSMGFDCEPEVLGYEGGVAPEVLGGVGSLEEVNRRRITVFGPWRAFSSTNNTLRVDEPESFVSNCYAADGEFSVHLVGGTGAGQVRDIIDNNGDTLLVDKNWTVNPDATTIFEIRKRGHEVVGEPSSLYDRKNTKQSRITERRGALYGLQYQIQVVGRNPESTIYLYMILKALFTLQRQFLERQGIIDMQMGGTDFVNRPEYLPDLAYMRAMNISFKVPFDVFQIEENIAEQFQIVLDACDDGTKAVVMTTELSDITPPAPAVGG